MKYIGLDIATTTGWAYFEDDKLLERGTIQLISGMEIPQKLHYFHLELDNLLKRLQPEYCFIEDVILAISGAKTLAYLARLNGVAINTAFTVLQERVKLYDPPYWKSHSYDGLGGMDKKWQIQLAVIKHYDLPITGDFDSINEQVKGFEIQLDGLKAEIFEARTIINKYKSQLTLKRNPLSDDEKKVTKQLIKEKTEFISALKKKEKEIKNVFDKKMVKVANDIAAQTGMTENICDACGVAYCGYKETSNV